MLCGLVVAGCSDAPRDRVVAGEVEARVCVRRTEDGDALGDLEARVVISDNQTIPLLGGQAVCAYVPPGSHSMVVQSLDPYDPSSRDPNAWASETIRFDLKEGQKAEFAVCGRSDGGGRASAAWVIQAAGGPAGGPRCG